MTEVSERAGLSQQMIAYVEKEIRVPGVDTVLRIAEALDLDIIEIVAVASKQSGARRTKSRKR